MIFKNFNRECPYCGSKQTVTESVYHQNLIHFDIGQHALGSIGLVAKAIACVNNECQMPTVSVMVVRDIQKTASGYAYWQQTGEPLLARRLCPENTAKPQPDYIPAPLREDYIEACRIAELSPKASATLARRCLQGMIRDFCGISKGTLNAEIAELRKRVDEGTAPRGVSPESVDAIDHVRKVGNIGAHMEKDINTIIPVDPDEAQLLIELIESLFEEWYVEREKRQARLEKLKLVAEAKAAIPRRAEVPLIEPPQE